jgi:hypothetical protein
MLVMQIMMTMMGIVPRVMMVSVVPAAFKKPCPPKLLRHCSIPSAARTVDTACGEGVGVENFLPMFCGPGSFFSKSGENQYENKAKAREKVRMADGLRCEEFARSRKHI